MATVQTVTVVKAEQPLLTSMLEAIKTADQRAKEADKAKMLEVDNLIQEMRTTIMTMARENETLRKNVVGLQTQMEADKKLHKADNKAQAEQNTTLKQQLLITQQKNKVQEKRLAFLKEMAKKGIIRCGLYNQCCIPEIFPHITQVLQEH